MPADTTTPELIPDLTCNEELSHDGSCSISSNTSEECIEHFCASPSSRSCSPLSAVDIFTDFNTNVLQPMYEQVDHSNPKAPTSDSYSTILVNWTLLSLHLNTYVPCNFIWHFINQSKTNYAYLLNTLLKNPPWIQTKCTTLWYVQNEIELYIQLKNCWSPFNLTNFFDNVKILIFERLVQWTEIGVKIIVYLGGVQTHNFAGWSDLAEFETKKFFGLHGCHYVNWVSGWSPTPQGVQLSPDFCSDFRSFGGKPSRLWSLVVAEAGVDALMLGV